MRVDVQRRRDAAAICSFCKEPPARPERCPSCAALYHPECLDELARTRTTGLCATAGCHTPLAIIRPWSRPAVPHPSPSEPAPRPGLVGREVGPAEALGLAWGLALLLGLLTWGASEWGLPRAAPGLFMLLCVLSGGLLAAGPIVAWRIVFPPPPEEL